jgi:hypothetical protein
MRNFLLLMFSLAGGLTLSGIVANLYRLLTKKTKDDQQSWAYYGVMILAGPTVLLDNATRSFRKKECTRTAYGFALGLATYWAFMLGAILLDVVVSI